MLISVVNAIFLKITQPPVFIVKITFKHCYTFLPFTSKNESLNGSIKCISSSIEDVNKIINMFLVAEVFTCTHHI